MATSRELVSQRSSQNQSIQTSKSFDPDESAGRILEGRSKSFSLLGLIAICLMLPALASTGCCIPSGSGGWGAAGPLHRFMVKQVNCMRDQIWAHRAYHLRCGGDFRHPHGHDYREGFVEGYGSVCKGGNGETPVLPPEKYWSFNYSSQEGAEMQNAWFDGFRAGAMAAKEDGTASFHQIQISQEVDQAMQIDKQMKEIGSGVEKAYVFNSDMAPITSSSNTVAEPAMPTRLPTIGTTQFPTTGTLKQPSLSVPMPVKRSTIRPITDAAFDKVQPRPSTKGTVKQQSLSVPMPLQSSTIRPNTDAAFEHNKPFPIQNGPEDVPIIPGNSKR